MSLYEALMGQHPFAHELLAVCGLNAVVVPRWRDCFLLEVDAEIRVGVFTRTGGGNRGAFAKANAWLTAHRQFVRDYDDAWDSTFATFEFRPVPEAVEIVTELHALEAFLGHDARPPMVRYRDLLDRLADPAHAADADVVRAMAFGKKLVSRIEGGGPDADVDGHLTIVPLPLPEG